MTNTNLIERLRYFTANGDHERGCQGREYSCTCQFDENEVVAVNEAAALIEQQEAVIASLVEQLEDTQEWVTALYEFGVKPGTMLVQGPYSDGCQSRMGSINAALLAAKTHLEE